MVVFPASAREYPTGSCWMSCVWKMASSLSIGTLLKMKRREPPRKAAGRCSEMRSLASNRGLTMPMIDVYAAADLFPPGADRQLGEELTLALLRAEGVEKPGPTHLNNTGAYIHRMPATAVNT